jgi:phenylacetate-coenzyme A ligase PaaK-like adenylate-forming protein
MKKKIIRNTWICVFKSFLSCMHNPAEIFFIHLYITCKGRADDITKVKGVLLSPAAVEAVVRSFDGLGDAYGHAGHKRPALQRNL